MPAPEDPLAAFHPTLARWFRERLGEPTRAQERGWAAIGRGEHVLIAAPTGSGKTLAAFLSGLDGLLQEGEGLADATRVLYVSPLRALSNDVRKNLHRPLTELRERDPSLPEVRVLVRTGDTPQRERQAMRREPPHVLVTTPESLYILLTSAGGRELLAGVRTAIVDEVHALVGDKRGAHLLLSLERLEALTGGVQRIGLSATQKPLADVARFLVGVGRECTLVDEGHFRELDLAIEVPPSPLETVCSHETWDEVYRRLSELILAHRTTLVFVGTRKLSEQVGARLTGVLGKDQVACHHSSLSKERRLDAEERLKAGSLRALVATASLELGIDVGEVDLVCQVGATRSIATFLQRVGRSGHGVGRTPKGRVFPLTVDEVVEAAALVRAVLARQLDRTPQPVAPLDVLAQQVVAECVGGPQEADELFARLTRAWPYRDLERGRFDATVDLHCGERLSLLHRDGVGGRLLATKRARLAAVTSGGAIPDRADYRVVLEPEGTVIGSVDEDFAVEASGGDVFQLGNASWRVLKVERGTMRVADAKGAPPSLPFWFGEAPARTRELSEAITAVRVAATDPAWAAADELLAPALTPGVADQLAEHVQEGVRVLGCVPTTTRTVLERFFDESGGTQLVLHAPYGGRVNRALGLALRKRFCRHFGFELQAAANEDAIVLSLGPQHSFPLEDVYDFLHPDSAREVLVQAVLPLPLFATRWRWNVCRALLVERMQGGKRVAAPLLRMRSDDLLVKAFPDVVACGENLPPGDVEVPLDHPMVAQTIHDCLHEAMDADGMLAVLRGWRDGSIERVALDVPEPSAFSRSILNAKPYAFLDDAPLEERRTQAVLSRRVLDPKTADELGALSPAAVERVRREAWPDPASAEEVHEALLWMGWVEAAEAPGWAGWLEELRAAGRVAREGERFLAAEATRDPKAMLRGRLEALGPVVSEDPLLLELERDGAVLRCRLDGGRAWCDRRLLARIHRYTLDGLRREIEPVPAAAFLHFLAAWQHVLPGHRVEGPEGLRAVLRQLAGFEVPAGSWEKGVLAARVQGYRPEWLDELGLRGELAWGRLYGDGNAAPRATPLAFVPRAELGAWLALARGSTGPSGPSGPSGPPGSAGGTGARASAAPAESGENGDALAWKAEKVASAIAATGASFPADLLAATGLLPSDLEEGLAELVARGRATSDSFASVRHLLAPSHRRKGRELAGGRWSLLAAPADAAPPLELVARALLDRWGVVFHRLLERERVPVFWRDLHRVYRTLELRGEVRGGRFVAGFAGEQFAQPEAVRLLRRLRNEPRVPVEVVAADPLNLVGIVTPEPRVATSARRRVPLVVP